MSPWATCCWKASRDCYVRSDGMLAAVVGLQDAVVVVTEDAVLAMHRDQAQDVKKIVDRLKAAGRHEAVAHNRIYRPWGFYESLIQGDRFQVKRIVVSPGRSCRCKATSIAPNTGSWSTAPPASRATTRR